MRSLLARYNAAATLRRNMVLSLIWLLHFVRRAVTPDFGSLAAIQYRMEGAFRAVHTRLRTHAESVAFFGGGAAEVCFFCFANPALYSNE